MRIFKNKAFYQWAVAENIDDSTLSKAVQEIEKGLIETNLGGNVYKKRIAAKGRGKRGGARTILAYKQNNIAVFMYGYAKNEKENISLKEKRALKELASMYFQYNDRELDKAVKKKILIEVKV